MKITVFVERTGETKKLNFNNFDELFRKLSLNRNTVLITRNNELITEDEPLNENDEIKLVSVISGG